MTKPRLFLCGGTETHADGSESAERHVVRLNATGTDPNVTIRINDVARVFANSISARLMDALEIAAYVYAADAKTRRATKWEDDAIEPWSRDLRFRVAVRDVEFWQRPAVVSSLTGCLNFLTADQVSFEFTGGTPQQEAQGYLELGTEDWPFTRATHVVMFSGGLDSLAGAVECAVAGNPLVLVSHRAVSTISSRQRRLVQQLRSLFPNVPMLHVPVWINKADTSGNEPTQRSRSFLFTLLGTVVARLLGAQGIRFFENGIVSLNLPVADEAIRARSSRTTHPLALQYLATVAGLIADGSLAIENPYVNLTKAEVIQRILDNGARTLIAHTVSCARIMFKAKSQQHCGVCSQCIDRRIGILAAGCADDDPSTDYVKDVFIGARAAGYESNMAVHYARHATELETMSSEGFASKFNLEIARAIRGSPDSAIASEQLYDLHQRHARGVLRVLASQLQRHAEALVKRALPASSMLGLVAGQRHEVSMWELFAERVADILKVALPRACTKKPPSTEPELQAIADAILAGHDLDLIREYPFVRWSGSATKPDWSNEALLFWVELKYVRKRRDLLPISKDIAEDITKYGDSGRRVLFVVYDPQHLIGDEPAYSAPIASRLSMHMRFVR